MRIVTRRRAAASAPPTESTFKRSLLASKQGLLASLPFGLGCRPYGSARHFISLGTKSVQMRPQSIAVSITFESVEPKAVVNLAVAVVFINQFRHLIVIQFYNARQNFGEQIRIIVACAVTDIVHADLAHPPAHDHRFN